MLITPKLLRDIQSEILSGKLGVDRKEITDDQESGFCAVVGKRKITLYAKPTRGKRVKLGELGETFDDQRVWIKNQREKAASLRSLYKKQSGKTKPALPGSPAELTVSEYLAEFYYIESAGKAGVKNRDDKSQRAMRSAFSQFLDKKMSSFKYEDISDWRESYGQAVMRDDGHTVKKFAVKDVSRRRVFTVFNAVFNHAVTCKHLARNPFIDIKGMPPEFVDDGEEAGRPLSNEDIVRLNDVLNGVPARDRLFCKVMLLTGGRPCEVMSATVEGIQWDTKKMKVIAAKKKKTPGPSKEIRYLKFGDSVKAMLREFIESERITSGHIFRNHKAGPHWNKPMRRFDKPWRTISHRALIDNRLYDLRHTFAKNIYLRSKDIVVTSKMLGHSDISTTQLYLSRMGVEISDAAQDLENLILGLE
jgi:integrase